MLGAMGPASKLALPKLVLMLTEEKDPREEVRIAAALAQWQIAGDAESAVRFLKRSLKSDPRVARRAAWALGDMRSAAEPARSALEEAALHYDRDVRVSARRALRGLAE